MNATDRVVAMVPGSVCARFAAHLEGVVRADLRRQGLPIDPQLDRLLGELREAGEAWSEFVAATADATADGCRPICPSETVTYMTTKAAAEMIGTRERNVRDLIDRGRLRADPPEKGRGWRIHQASVEALIEERKTA